MTTELDLDALVRGFEPTREPGPLLRRAEQRHAEIFAAAMGAGGPTRQQLAALIELHRSPGATLTQLADATAIDRNSLAEMLGRLGKAGLVRRARAAHDARALSFALTAKGRTTLLEALPKARTVQDALLQGLACEERALFLACLRHIAES